MASGSGAGGTMNIITGIFGGVLVLSVIVGLIFLFTANIKTQVGQTAGNTSLAYTSVERMEQAGSDIVSYVPLVFLALIFSGILYIVFKVVPGI